MCRTRKRGSLPETARFVFPSHQFRAPFFAVVRNDLRLGLNAGPDSVQPFQKGGVQLADDLWAIGLTLKAAVIDVHDDAACADKSRGLRQPGLLTRGGVLNDDFVASVGTRVRRCAIGDLYKAVVAVAQGVEHQTRPPFGDAGFGALVVERKAEQHDIAELRRGVIFGCGKGLGVVIQNGLLWRGKTTPAGKAKAKGFSSAARHNKRAAELKPKNRESAERVSLSANFQVCKKEGAAVRLSAPPDEEVN